MRAPLATAALALALAACTRAEPPRWIELARGSHPTPLPELVARLEARVQPPRQGRIVPAEDGTLQFELPLPRDAWKQGGPPNQWRAPMPTDGAMALCDRSSLVLERGAKVWTKALRKQPGSRHLSDRFSVDGAEIVVHYDAAEGPPERIRGSLGNEREVGGFRRAVDNELVCNGFLVVPGEPQRLAVDVPSGSALSFSTVAPDPDGTGTELGATTFRVLLDGQSLLEHVQAHAHPVRADWHHLSLASGAHELTFAVEGPAPALFAAPVVGPADVGRPGRRPWDETRADIVLLLCDTFRADNLAAWGGSGAAPRLDALVERSVRFLDARATAAWTLPSIGTLLTGLYPGQHGGTDLDRAIADDVETLAGRLAAHGYRTVALTDALYFARLYGQDHGFEWFEETGIPEWNLADTLAKARSRRAADDGRPLFLVVHTYRVHVPLRVGPTEDAEPWNELEARLDREGLGPRHRKRMEAKRRFYLDAVADLDAKLGAWTQELDDESYLEHGFVVLTADHGEAFGEHDQVGHGGDLFDVELRVPLAIAGRDLAPHAVQDPVSLIDFAPTIAALAGVAPQEAWPGRSLLARGAPRPCFAFDQMKAFQQLAVFADGRKVMARDAGALRAGRPSHAFDLAQDPAEEQNVAASATWAAEVARRYADELESLLVPRSLPKTLELSAEARQELQAVGYGQ